MSLQRKFLVNTPGFQALALDKFLENLRGMLLQLLLDKFLNRVPRWKLVSLG
jgi:hypothetical protein